LPAATNIGRNRKISAAFYGGSMYAEKTLTSLWRCGTWNASSGILDILLSSSPFVVPSAPSLAPTLSDNSIHTPFTRSLIRSRGIGPAWHINSNRSIRKDLPEFMCLRSLFFFSFLLPSLLTARVSCARVHTCPNEVVPRFRGRTPAVMSFDKIGIPSC